MFNLHTRCLWLGLLILATSCGEAPQYRFGENVSGIQFEFFNENEGVHPFDVTLNNPNNPFREYDIGMDTRFDILDGGGNAGAFYAWATLLANIPIGEHQFFTSIKLRDIYLSNEVAEEDRDKVREASIRGFQAILDCFPDSQLFDATGTFVVQRLATLAFTEILDLGGVPQGDWELVTDSNGNPTAVRSTGQDTLSRDVQCFRNTVRIR